jgi:hypothetical protein
MPFVSERFTAQAEPWLAVQRKAGLTLRVVQILYRSDTDVELAVRAALRDRRMRTSRTA